MNSPTPQVTIICPAYNEEAAIAQALANLKQCLDRLDETAEVLLINDGSTDNTVKLAKEAIGGDPRFRILSHVVNFGRGRALRTGFEQARGEIIVTTEADLSWGESIIGDMLRALREDPGADAVFASPHLAGGGYQNVPKHRVFLSTWGNRILNFLSPQNRTMVTGMTRAYRSRVIKPHLFIQDGKELHLEIAYRLTVLGHKIIEAPAVLSWPDTGLAQKARAKRTQFKKLSSLISSHLIFGIVTGGAKIMGISLGILSFFIALFSLWAVWRLLFTVEPSIYLVILIGVMTVLWVTLASVLLLFSRSLSQEVLAFKAESQLYLLQNSGEAPKPGQGYYREESLV